MDRKIPPNEVLRKERNIKLIKFGAVILVFVVVIAIIISLLRESINLRNIQLSTVDTGTIEVSVSASGEGSAGVRRNHQHTYRKPHCGSVQESGRLGRCRHTASETGFAKHRNRLPQDAR